MKKILFLFLFFFALAYSAISQTVPQGMKYQAVARNLNGKILANQPVNLRISLTDESGREIFYSETHQAKTNPLGLFDLTVGGGNVLEGIFSEIPWSTKDIWLEVALDETGDNRYVPLHSSRLLTVPYAFHAATASDLVFPEDGARSCTGGGVPANVWSKQGNCETDPSEDKLGTTDCQDLVIVTDNQERLRITCAGNLNMGGNLSVGSNLNISNSIVVGNDVAIGDDLNVADDATVGSDLNVTSNTTTNNLTVNNSATISNDLNVTDDATIGSDLNVTSNTTTNNLTVNNNATVGNDLNVTDDATVGSDLNVTSNTTTNDLMVNNSATVKNDLTVADDVTINGDITVTGASTFTGGVSVAATISGVDLNISNSATIGNDLNVTDDVTIGSDLTVTSKTTTNNLMVNNSATVGNDLSVTDDVTIGSDLTVTSKTTTNDLMVNNSATIGNDLSVADNATVSGGLTVSKTASMGQSLTVATSTTTNSLSVTNGATVGGNATVSGNLVATNLTANNNVIVNNLLQVNGEADFNGTVQADALETGDMQVSAACGGSDGNFNDYPFRVSGGSQGIAIKVCGSRNNSNNFISFWDNYDMHGRIEGQTSDEYGASSESIWLNTMGALDLAFSVAEGVATGVQLDIAEVIVMAVEGVAGTASWIAEAVENADAAGVAYESDNGDYAEWLERANPTEDLHFGEIVGVKAGKISRTTRDADHLMVVSKAPIVLGNMPPAHREADFEKVAFMGQVPVQVIGKVKTGDYILPSGNNDGFGIAVSPADMKLENYARIVGVAWEASSNDMMNVVNVAVGINANDLAGRVAQQQHEIEGLKAQMNQVMAYLQGQSKDLGLPNNQVAGTANAPITFPTPVAAASISPAAMQRYSDEWLEKNRSIFEEKMNQVKAEFAARGFDINQMPTEARQILNDPVQAIKDMQSGKFNQTLWENMQQRRVARQHSSK